MSGCELDGPQHGVPCLALHDSGDGPGSAVILSQLCCNHPSGYFL